MSAALSALFALFPGFVIVYFLNSKERPFDAQICDAIIVSLLLESAVAWLPGGSAIPFGVWLVLSLLLTAAGGVLFVRRAIGERAQLRAGSTHASVLRAVALGALALYAVILLVRPNIDWDAITYYLPSSLNFTLSGHMTDFLSQYVTTAPGAPNVQPPIMPVLYALAIGVAQILHSTADVSIRLFALVFVAGTWLSVRRLASAFLPPFLAEAAALLYLLLPATISTVSANPLLLDLGFTFLCTALVAEMVHLPDNDPRSWVRIGCIASAVVLFKINGLPFVILVGAAVILTRLPSVVSRIAAGAIALAMVALSARFGFFDGVATVSLAISIAVVAGLLIYSAGPRAARWHGSRSAVLAAIAALIPGALHLLKMTVVVGSPAAYYIPQLAKVKTYHWHQALSVLNSAHLYAATTQPGLPEHFGPGLLFWWGFSPTLAVFALVGIILAGKSSEAISQISLICLMFAAAFLTIFRLDDFRHLLPVTPLIPVLALYAIYRLRPEDQWSRWFTLLLIAAVPFFWIGQQTFFTPPMTFLASLHWDQWNALSFAAFENIAVFVAAFALLGTSAFRLPQPNSRTLSIAATVSIVLALAALIALQRIDIAVTLLLIAAVLLCGYVPSGWQKVAVAAITLALFFEPVIATATSPGFSAQSAQVTAAQDGGYLTVLWPALNKWNARLLLTFKSYGITWFSLGRARRLELTDASDLGRIAPILREKDPREIRESLGIDGTLLPSLGGSEYSAFQSLLAGAHLEGISSLSDPLLSLHVQNENWTYRGFFPMTQPESLEASLDLVSENRRSAVSDQALTPSSGWTQIEVHSSAFHSGAVTAHIYAAVYSDGQRNYMHIAANAPFGKIDLGKLSVRLHAKPGSLIDFRAIAFSANNGATASFRSEGLELKHNGSGFALVRGAPMVLHAEDGLVDSVIALDSNGHSLRLFPAPAMGDLTVGQLALTFSLRSDPLCPPGSPMRLTISGAVTSGSVNTPITEVLSASSDGRVKWPLSGRLHQPAHGPERFALKSIIAEGTAPSCAISETIVPEAFSVTLQANGTSALDVVPALPFHVQSVKIGKPLPQSPH